jgi:hypothetical protein
MLMQQSIVYTATQLPGHIWANEQSSAGIMCRLCTAVTFSQISVPEHIPNIQSECGCI